MSRRVVQTNDRLAAERQIHAAISHFHAGEFECAISLCSAAENRIPEPSNPNHLLHILKRAAKDNPSPTGEKDDFNYMATWLKHDSGPDGFDIKEVDVLFWLNRAISKYRATYGIGTDQMASLFPWAASPPQKSNGN